MRARVQRRNSQTWENAPSPALDRVDAEVKLFPERRGLTVSGTYVLRNPPEWDAAHAEYKRREAVWEARIRVDVMDSACGFEDAVERGEA